MFDVDYMMYASRGIEIYLRYDCITPFNSTDMNFQIY